MSELGIIETAPAFQHVKPPKTTLRTSAPGARPQRSLQQFKNLAIGVSSFLTALAVPLVGHWISSAINEREIQGKFVELAVNILREEPSQDKMNIRRWATDVINKYSGVPLDNQTKETLIKDEPLFTIETTTDARRFPSLNLARLAPEPLSEVRVTVLLERSRGNADTPDPQDSQRSFRLFLNNQLIHRVPQRISCSGLARAWLTKS